MSKHSVEVRQLRSDGASFLNVDDGMGHIGVWTQAYQRPTVLLRHDHTVRLMQFDSEEWMKEWLDAQPVSWVVEHLDPIDKRPEVALEEQEPQGDRR